MNNIKYIRKKAIGILIILLFLISILTPVIDLSGLKARNINATPKTSDNCLFNGKLYTFNLDDFYDDENLYKTYTGAKFQTEIFNDTTMAWSGTVLNDTVTPVNNTETQYGDPSNINMINGTTDSADNMKVNDDSSTNFTSTHTDGYIYETPSQWDNFTFTNGTGDTIGELETIDANYSTLISTENIIAPNEFITSVDYTDGWCAQGVIENTWIDDGDSYLMYNDDDYVINAELLFDEALAGRDFLISVYYNMPTASVMELRINDVMWKSDDQDFDNVLAENVNKISFYVVHTSTAYVRIYYFKIVEVDGGTPALLDVQVDIQVNDPDCSSIEFLKFSHKTNISVDVDLDIWNWDTTTWYEIESVINFATFDDDSFTLGIDSDYVNSSFGVRIRFQATTLADFELQIDRLRLDYFTIPAELEFTITFTFANYNEDLLAITIQSWQKTNISQIINFSIWNFDTEDYIQISSSSDIAFDEKEYNTTSPNDFISPTGTVKLYWIGSNPLNDFELHIDYLFVQIFYKLDLVHSKSFDTNGVYRYRWVVLGSIHYTQWVVFEVVDPIPNFHAISESDVTTRWILQNATLTPVENFTDDISGSNWYLEGVSEETFEKTYVESVNYLLDNYSTTDTMSYSGIHFDVGTEDTAPFGITWDGTYFWVSGAATTDIYKYNAAGVYQDVHFDVGAQDSNQQGITWDGTDLWVVGAQNDEVYKYTSAGVYTDVHFDIGAQDTMPSGITWDGTYFWVVGYSTTEVYKYNAAGVYQDVHFDVGTEDTAPFGITWDGTYFWVVGALNNDIYKYNAAGVYQDVHFDVGAQDSNPQDITWDGTDLWVVGYSTTEVYKYTANYDISKKYQGSGYIYMQTNITEAITLQSTVYGTNYTLSSGDYFEVDFQTSSDSKINLILLKDGVINKTLTLSPSGNTNFNRHIAKASVDEDVEFDQLKISSTFEDTDYVKVYDIKTKKYTLTGDSADFYVGSKRTESVYLTPDTYNLRILEEGDEKIDTNITISSDYYYIYAPTQTQYCRLALFNTEGTSLTFTDYHIKINRSLNGEYYQFWLLDIIFYADDETYVYIKVYDRFDSLIGSFERLASDYIDLEIEVYSLQIKNLQTQKTTVDINSTHVYPLLSGDSLYFMLSKNYYQIGYYDTNDVYKQFLIYLNSNQAYELNRSKICFLAYVNQKGEHLYFENYKTYLNGTLLYENVFYKEIGDKIGIEVKDIYGISIKNQTYTVVSGDNYIPVVLTLYSLKVMSQQLCFNHINITRDPNYYESSYYWSEWIAPSEIIEFNLFAGYYKINLTNNEDETYSYYSYTFSEDSILLIGSNNTIYNVLVNIANVNATIGNQITNVEINITNQNSNINNTIVNIEINLSNVNSTLGSILLDINTAISNINSTIVSEIVSLSTELSNINSSITNEILTISTDLSNVNSSVISQLLTLGVDISNINGSIVNQIIDLGVDITNINTSLSNQILSIGVDISNLDTSITDQIVLVISNITNINTTLSTQITSLSSDITNVNSTIVNQIVALGVDITNINTSLSNQILSLEVDISNINATIVEQVLLVIADIENIETQIDDQTLVILSDITNVNSTLLNQMVVLGVDITNINATITNQILDLSVDLTNINSSISNLLTNINISISNLENDIGTFYAFTNTSFINLNNVMNTSFINIETTIYSINQTISNLVIGVSNDIYLINGTISTMITQLETNLLLMNVSINTALFDLDTTLDLIGSNITSNYILLNNSIYLNSLNINDSRIAIINNLLMINNTISALVSEVYSAVYLINNSIYTAVVDLGTYLSLMNNTINGNLSIVLQMNEFLTEIYKMTMFSDLLNWTDIGLNITLLTSQIDAWEFINDYRDQSIQVFLRYNDLIENLTVSAQNTIDQYLPKEDVEYRLWSEELQEYINEWTPLPENRSVDFGFYEEEVPEIPSFDNTSITMFLIILIFIGVIGLSTYFVYKYNKRVQNLKVAYARQHTVDRDVINGVAGRSSQFKRIK